MAKILARLLKTEAVGEIRTQRVSDMSSSDRKKPLLSSQRELRGAQVKCEHFISWYLKNTVKTHAILCLVP